MAIPTKMMGEQMAKCMRNLSLRSFVILLTLLLLVGCEGSYALLAENCSSQMVTVEWDYKPRNPWTLAPCTGHASIWEIGPPGNPEWSLVVKDAQGTALTSATIQAISNDAKPQKSWYLYRYATESRDCRAPIEGYYRILVRNQGQDVWEIVLGDWYPGSLQPGEETEVLRVGNIAEADALWPRTLGEPREALWDEQFDRSVPDYRIGDVPTLVITLY